MRTRTITIHFGIVLLVAWSLVGQFERLRALVKILRIVEQAEKARQGAAAP